MLKYLHSLRVKASPGGDIDQPDNVDTPFVPIVMSPMVDPSGILAELEKSQLVSADKVRAYQASHQESPLADRAWAERLVSDRAISTFQATRLLQGRWRELFYGDYRVVHKLHNGGVGLVYLAHHATQPGWFALKILKPNRRDDAAAVDMFRLEALALTTLRHANIVRGIEYSPFERGSEHGHFLAMEFVRGPNLGELLAIRRELPIGQACDIIMQAAEGLSFAHEHHFLHRDIKPCNLIVDTSGATKLVDFGFARFTGPQLPFPIAPTGRPGTMGFYAPEALSGERMRDRRSDIYSLGLTLYFALTGVQPFVRQTREETLLAQRDERPRPIVELRPDLPAALVAIVERMIAPDAEDRYATMAEIAQALAPFAAREPLSLSMRALLRARARIQPRDYLASSAQNAKPVVGVVAEIPKPEPLSELRTLEAFVRRISDQLTAQRAENRRLSDELEQHISHRAELEQRQAEQAQLRDELRRTAEENRRLTTEVVEARSVIEQLSSRCVELEMSLAEYKQQVFEITLRADDATEPVTVAGGTMRRGDEQRQALRVAYEQASPTNDVNDNSDSFDEVFTDDSLLREIAQAHWATLR
jgi:serine/threonine protein kinase